MRMTALRAATLALLLIICLSAYQAAAQPSSNTTASNTTAQCGRTIEADIVAIDHPIFLNRLGASMPGGMIYALRRDVIAGHNGSEIAAGNVQLDPNRRPRPLVLRMRVGDCLHIKFQNLLSPQALGPNTSTPASNPPACDLINIYPEQTCTRIAGVHVVGMDEQVVNGTLIDGSFVGANRSSLVGPSERIDYLLRAPAEGAFLMYSAAANALTSDSGGGLGGQLSAGLFGSVVVEPRSSEWYRSQVTKVDLDAVTVRRTPDGHPVLNYGALRQERDGSCTPILRMVDVRYRVGADGKCVALGSDLVTYHGDLTALVTGPNAGPFPQGDNAPPFNSNPVEPNRHEPYREFVQHYHDVLTVSPANQAFPGLYSGNDTSYVLNNGGEAFAINYGTGGIGSEILANRLGVGPEGGCVECRFEEFFLSSWAVGDPAQLVGKPVGLRPNYSPQRVPYQPKTVLHSDDEVKYPDDPSNVYHSYVGDRVIFRIVHAGQLVTHVHHLHAHQWLHTRNNGNSTYLDSQLISAGSSFTQEIDYNGSGNRNRTPGDAIFHCHSGNYAQWGLFRIGPKADDVVILTAYQRTTSQASSLTGYVTPDLRTGRYAREVELVGRPDRAAVDQATGAFHFALADAPATVTVRSENGAQATAALPPAVPVPRVARPLAPQVPPIASAPGGVGATHVERMQSKAAKFLPRQVNQPPAAP
jgi:hypothetical protein